MVQALTCSAKPRHEVLVKWVPDPSDRSGADTEPFPMPWIDQTVEYYLDTIGIPHPDDVEIQVRIDGRGIDREEWKYTFVPSGCELHIVRFPDGLGVLAAVAVGLATVTKTGIAIGVGGLLFAGLVNTLIATGLSFLVSLFQEKPSLPRSPEEFTYGAGGVRTGTGLGMPIPIVYGEHIVGGHMIEATSGHIGGRSTSGQSYSAITGGKRTRLTIALSEGPISEIAGYSVDADYQWFNKLGKDALLYGFTPNFNHIDFREIGINTAAGQERIAISFTTGPAIRTISEITLPLKLYGTPAASSRISVEFNGPTGAGINNAPDGIAIGEVMSKFVNALNPTGHVYQKFSPSFPILLAANTVYWIVISVDYTLSAVDYVSIAYYAGTGRSAGSTNIKKGNDASPFSWNPLTPFLSGDPPTGAYEIAIATVRSEAEEFAGFGKLKINGSEIESYAANGYMGVRMGKLSQQEIPGESDVSFEQPTDVALPIDKWQFVGTTTGPVNGFGLVVSFPQGWYRSGRSGPAGAEFRLGVAWRAEGEGIDRDSQFFMERALYFGKPDAITVRIDLTQRKGQPVPPGSVIEVRAIQFPAQGVDFEVRAESIKEYFDGDAQTHPHLAMLYIDADVPSATGQIENVTTLIKGRVMHYYDDGVWRYGYTDNPSHCCLDLILNERYGGGATMTLDNVSLPDFQEWADFNDELIFDGEGYIKRSQLAIVIDEERTWWDWCKQIASTSRCKLLPLGNVIKPKVDKPRDMTQVLTRGNIVEDSFVIRYLPRRNRANKVISEFLNAENNYAFETVEEEDQAARVDEEDVIVETVSMIGINNAHRARRAAKYALNLNRDIGFGGELRAFIDMVNAEPGDVIGIESDIPDWDQVGGRVDEGFGGSFRADHDFTYEDTTDPYVVTFWVTDTSSPGGQREIVTRTLTVPSPLPSTATAGTLIPFDVSIPSNLVPAQGDPYSIRRLRDSLNPSAPPETALIQAQIVDMELTEDYQILIRFMEYNESVYNDTPGNLNVKSSAPAPLNRNIPPAPTGLQLNFFKDGRGNYAARLDYTAATVPGVRNYKIAVHYRIVNFMNHYERQEVDADSIRGYVTIQDDKNNTGLIPGLTYEVVLTPISPTTGDKYTAWSKLAARTTRTLQDARLRFSGVNQQIQLSP